MNLIKKVFRKGSLLTIIWLSFVFVSCPNPMHVIVPSPITYDGNGNTGGTAPVESMNYYSDSTVIVLANTGNLTKTGYSFAGWNTKADGTGIDREVGTIFTLGPVSVTLYAKWTALPTYTVTYDGNGYTGGTVPADTNHYLEGATVPVASQGTLARTGYSFAGWNTKADGSGTDIATGSTFLMGSVNVVLYAKWTQLPTYTVTYNGNGSTSGTVPTDANRYLEGGTVIVALQGMLARTGYSFIGWNTNADGSGTDIAAGSTLLMGSANVVLYAKWTQLPTYTVTYNWNGVTGGTVLTDPNHYFEGAIVIVSLRLERTGYSFIGWNTKADGSGTDIATGSTFLMGSVNVVLYAKWTQLPTYTVTYNGNGSTSGTVPTDANHYLEGATVTVASQGTLTRTGYSFAGWNTKTDGTGTDRVGGSSFTIGSTNVVLYAKWAQLPTYTVTYNGNGSTGGTVPTDANHYLEGATVSIQMPGSLVRTGYVFCGWNTMSDGSGTYIGNTDQHSSGWTFTMPSLNLVLYAQWLKTCDLKGRLLYNRMPFLAGIDPTLKVTVKNLSRANPNASITYCSIDYSSLTGEYVIKNLPLQEVTIDINFKYSSIYPTFGENYFTTYILNLQDMTEAELTNYDIKILSNIKMKKPYSASIVGRYSYEPYPVHTSPLVFEWEPVSGATYYRVDIYKYTKILNSFSSHCDLVTSVGAFLTSYSASLASCLDSQYYQIFVMAYNQYNEPFAINYYAGGDFSELGYTFKIAN
jgi:uncharacterized repeat protein (TIGR02543 family)